MSVTLAVKNACCSCRGPAFCNYSLRQSGQMPLWILVNTRYICAIHTCMYTNTIQSNNNKHKHYKSKLHCLHWFHSVYIDWLVTYRDAQPDIKQKDLGTRSCKWHVFIKFLSWELRVSSRSGGKGVCKPDSMKEAKRTRLSRTAHMDSERRKQQAQSLYRSVPCPLYIYYSFQFSHFMKICEWKGLWFLWLPLGLVSFCWFAMFNFYVTVFYLPYILFCLKTHIPLGKF